MPCYHLINQTQKKFYLEHHWETTWNCRSNLLNGFVSTGWRCSPLLRLIMSSLYIYIISINPFPFLRGRVSINQHIFEFTFNVNVPADILKANGLLINREISKLYITGEIVARIQNTEIFKSKHSQLLKLIVWFLCNVHF